MMHGTQCRTRQRLGRIDVRCNLIRAGAPRIDGNGARSGDIGGCRVRCVGLGENGRCIVRLSTDFRPIRHRDSGNLKFSETGLLSPAPQLCLFTATRQRERATSEAQTGKEEQERAAKST